MKTFWLVLFSSILLSACRNESQPAPSTPTPEAPKPTPEAPKSAPMAENTSTPPPFNSPKIDFEHFGNFDLSTWQSTPTKLNDTEGDVVTETVEYKKDGATMMVETAQSEYGHSVTHTLKGKDGKVQKIRVLELTNDTKELTETVNDYTMNPAKKFARSQKVDKSWQQFSPVLITATGQWKESAADQLEE
jgi:hypothetical protein